MLKRGNANKALCRASLTASALNSRFAGEPELSKRTLKYILPILPHSCQLTALLTQRDLAEWLLSPSLLKLQQELR